MLNKITKPKAFCFTGLLLTFLFISCSTDQESGDVIMPLSIGNKWDYKVTTNNGSTHLKTLEIVDRKEIDGNEFYVIESSPMDAQYFMNHDDGLFYYGQDGDVLNTPNLYIKYPGSVGDRYEFFSEGNYAEIISINDKIETEAGVFTCYHIKAVYAEIAVYNLWFSPNIGKIKEIYTLDTVEEICNTHELTNFILN